MEVNNVELELLFLVLLPSLQLAASAGNTVMCVIEALTFDLLVVYTRSEGGHLRNDV